MAIGVLILGGSGTGKSSSIEGLNPEETIIIQVHNKPLPFNSTQFPKKNIISTDNIRNILGICLEISEKAHNIKNIVIDDVQYVAANEFMRRVKEKTFDKFTDIGKAIWDLGNISSKLREDLIIYQLSHDEEIVDADGYRKRKAKTIGKLVDEKITLEGMYTIVLFTDVKKNAQDEIEYNFVTQNIGNTTAKSPKGMFESLNIPNDLGYVGNVIRKFYNI
jgi:hypothetical protein